MTDLLADFWVHDISLERYAGSGAKGDTFAAPVNLTGFVDDSTKLVRASNGDQVVSSARVFLPPATAAVPLKSRVTLNGPFLGRKSQVITVSVHDAGALDLPGCVEVGLL